MLRASSLIVALPLLTISPRQSHAQNTASAATHPIDPVLMAKARISLDSARTIAIHRVKGGHIVAEELEREHGRLIYSFDVKVPHESGIREVNVSAMNGTVIGLHHESAATEAKEAHDDSIAARKSALPRTNRMR